MSVYQFLLSHAFIHYLCEKFMVGDETHWKLSKHLKITCTDSGIIGVQRLIYHAERFNAQTRSFRAQTGKLCTLRQIIQCTFTRQDKIQRTLNRILFIQNFSRANNRNRMIQMAIYHFQF